jgi:hypothetical protein
MFDASLCPADALQQITDLRRRLVAKQLEKLCARDVELLFADGYCQPDWGLADVLGAERKAAAIVFIRLVRFRFRSAFGLLVGLILPPKAAA